MIGISHKQAIKWIDRRLDGLLDERQRLFLEEHLNSCDECRAYAAEMDLLPARIQNEFHLRWSDDPGPSQKVIDHVARNARSIPMAFRFSSGMKVIAGFAALVALAFLLNFVVSQFQNESMRFIATQPADSSSLPEEGLLAFTSDQTGNLEIYTMRPNGSRLTNLTDHPANDFNPFWSPDGRRIAFESDRTGSTQIFLMDADGSNVTQLTDGEVDHRLENLDPWSPDGSKLIFKEKAGEDEKWMLYVIDADGQNKIQLVQTPQTYAAISWSSDSKHIAFVIVELPENRDQASIYVVDTHGKNLTNITKLLPEDEVLKYWIYRLFRERNSITFTAGRDEGQKEGTSRKIEEKASYAVYEASLDGNTLNEIATYYATLPGGDWWDGTAFVKGIVDDIPSLTWLRSDGTSSILRPFDNCQTKLGLYSTYERSSNGSLMYAAQCGNGDKWLYWANPDGTEIKQLLDSPISPKPGNSPIHNISLSADGYSVAFNIASSDNTEMYVLNVHKALKDPFIQPERLVVGGPEFTSYNISWQPGLDNNIAEEKPTPEPTQKSSYSGLIAFTSASENGDYEIYSMRPDGNGLTNLTNNLANDFNPFWSPDGKRVAFESDRTGPVQIFLMDADGSNVIQLTNGGAAHEFKVANPWSPDGRKLIFTERAPGEENWVLFVMDADGQNKTQLVPTPNYYGAFSWSPDSAHIAFDFVEPVNNRDMTRIYVVGADGNNLTNVTKLLPDDEDLTSGNFPWAADGESIFFVAERYAWEFNNSRSAVYEASLDGTQLTEVFATSDRVSDWWNGTAFVHGRNGPTSVTWVHSDGTSSSFRPFENCQTRDSGSNYRRSTSGNLLYGAVCDDGNLWLYWINSDGTAIRQLLDSPLSTKGGGLVDISWSPDDAFIAFTIAFSDRTEMYVLNVNEALKNPSIQPDKYVVGGPRFVSYNISWQPQP